MKNHPPDACVVFYVYLPTENIRRFFIWKISIAKVQQFLAIFDYRNSFASVHSWDRLELCTMQLLQARATYVHNGALTAFNYRNNESTVIPKFQTDVQLTTHNTAPNNPSTHTRPLRGRSSGSYYAGFHRRLNPHHMGVMLGCLQDLEVDLPEDPKLVLGLRIPR